MLALTQRRPLCAQITPAHDAKDFATGKRHNLQFINILNDDGTLNGNCGPYAGKPRYEVRVFCDSSLQCIGQEHFERRWHVPQQLRPLCRHAAL